MLKRILIGVVALAAISGIGLFILDRTIFAPVAVSSAVPNAPKLSTPSLAAKSDPSAQLFRIDASQSEVDYQVNETLFQQGNKLNTAIGRTKAVAGDVLVNLAQPAKSQIGPIVIDISQFTSDESRRDNFIRRTGLESGKYPTATFVTTAIAGLPVSVKDGDSMALTISGDLTVKQTTKPVTWTGTLTLKNGTLVGAMTANIKMSDFGVGPIQISMLATEDAVKLAFNFVATAVAN